MIDDDWTAGIDSLTFSECQRCRHRWYLPHAGCPGCGASHTRRIRSTGTGFAIAVTAVSGTQPGGESPSSTFGICLVELDEGVRVMGRADSTVRVGDQVRVTWDRHHPLFVILERPQPTDRMSAG